MYARVYRKRDAKEETLDKFIETDIAAFKKNSGSLSVVESGPLPTAKDKLATVSHFSGDMYRNSEAVAYIDEGKVIVMLVVSARTKEAFTSALPAFKELVGSYSFLSDKVTTRK